MDEQQFRLGFHFWSEFLYILRIEIRKILRLIRILRDTLRLLISGAVKRGGDGNLGL